MSDDAEERQKRVEERLERAAKLGLTPAEIAERLGKSVVGQDEAVRAVSLAIHDHIHARVGRIYAGLPFIGDPPRIAPLMLVGPTGCGKSQLMRAVARLTSLPTIHAAATELTQTGYTGASVGDVCRRLLIAAEGNMMLASLGLMFLDEIDKKAARGGLRNGLSDVAREDAQDTLLPLLEGGTVMLDLVDSSGGTPRRHERPMSCSALLLILGGAFSGIEDTIRRRLHRGRRMGFGTQSKVELSDPEVRTQLSPVDLIEFGMKSELVGRIGQIVVMPSLSREALRKILTEVPDGPLQTAQAIARTKGYEYEFSDGLIDEIVDRAARSNLGARALGGLVNRATARAAFEVPGRMRQERLLPGQAIVYLRRDSLDQGYYALRRRTSPSSGSDVIEEFLSHCSDNAAETANESGAG